MYVHFTIIGAHHKAKESPMKVQNQGNNESLSCGVNANSDGTFTALTFSQSKTFKTEKGAIKWIEKIGYNKNGESI